MHSERNTLIAAIHRTSCRVNIIARRIFEDLVSSLYSGRMQSLAMARHCITNQLSTLRLIMKPLCNVSARFSSSDKADADVESPRMQEFKKKLRERTPIGKLEELEAGKHPYQEKEPLKPFPDNTNPETGEVGGPRGPEPTRYGDWERKGRVSDF